MRYRFGRYILDTGTLQLLDGAAEVDVEPQVFAVLTHLVEHRERVVSKEELLDEVWGSRFVSESALTTRIKQARQALGDSGRDQAVIRTLHGRGYRFVAEVEEVGGTSDREVLAPLAPTPMPPPARPDTRYAEADGASIAYQTFGQGPDVVLVSGFASNVEVQWELPGASAFLERLARFARVTVFDKRGVGLSDRVPHDAAPSLETRADDLLVVLAAAGIERATVIGSSEGGSLAAVFAATHPDRVERLVLHDTWAGGHDFSRPSPGYLSADQVQESWGTGRVFRLLAPSLAAAPGGRELLARYERQSATPRTARQLLELISSVDLTRVLPAISVPTLVLHRADDQVIPLADGRELAAGIPDARLVVLEGADHYLFSGDPTATLDCIESFLAGAVVDPDAVDRVLATVLVVEAANGDRGSIHDLADLAAPIVERHRGRVTSTSGPGATATFDAPGRAVRAAFAVLAAAAGAGLPVRCGAHTAEVRIDGRGVSGVGMQVARAVAASAGPGEVWVSRTVTDLVAGTGLRFESRGEHALDGVSDRWHLFAASG